MVTWGCSSVIEYSQNLIWPRSIFFILTLSLPTSPIGDVIADCQHRRSATWTPSPNHVQIPFFLQTLCCFQSILDFDISYLGYLWNIIERKGRKNQILESSWAWLFTMPLAVKINVPLREQNCQKIGSKRVKALLPLYNYIQGLVWLIISGVLNNYDYRWMVMLDFICMGSTELFGTGWDWKIQNENLCLQRDLNPCHTTTSDTGL